MGRIPVITMLQLKTKNENVKSHFEGIQLAFYHFALIVFSTLNLLVFFFVKPNVMFLCGTSFESYNDVALWKWPSNLQKKVLLQLQMKYIQIMQLILMKQYLSHLLVFAQVIFFWICFTFILYCIILLVYASNVLFCVVSLCL